MWGRQGFRPGQILGGGWTTDQKATRAGSTIEEEHGTEGGWQAGPTNWAIAMAARSAVEQSWRRSPTSTTLPHFNYLTNTHVYNHQ